MRSKIIYYYNITTGTNVHISLQICLSFASSITLFFHPSVSFMLALVNVAAIAAAYMHLTGFWKAKAEVPFVTGFNEGIRKSNDLRRLLVSLGAAWAVTGVVESLWR